MGRRWRGAGEARRGEARRGGLRRGEARRGIGGRRAEGEGGGRGGPMPRRAEGHLFDEAFLHGGEGPPLPLRVLLRGPVRRRFPRGGLAVAAAAAAAAAARGAVGRDSAQRRRRAVAVGGQPRLLALLAVDG
eukprot:scaffold85766_cov58-Phaeocystis_antarctica.AAC.1